jgi:23S rRNA pseudouridine1911/1915/1917 synthase
MAPIPIVHRDDWLVVVSKPAGVLSVPAPTRRGSSLVDLLTHQLGQRVLAVHRLDEETTGVMVFALRDESKAALEEVFRLHSIRREYLALATAAPAPAAGTIRSNLVERPDGLVVVAPRGGQPAVTHYETIGRRGRCTLVSCRLETGRRNQIRVHLAAMGCVLAGDRKYGYRARSGETFSRVMLHSWRMAFDHPLLAVRIDITVPPAEPELHL